jgi:hypothetical protein
MKVRRKLAALALGIAAPISALDSSSCIGGHYRCSSECCQLPLPGRMDRLCARGRWHRGIRIRGHQYLDGLCSDGPRHCIRCALRRHPGQRGGGLLVQGLLAVAAEHASADLRPAMGLRIGVSARLDRLAGLLDGCMLRCWLGGGRDPDRRRAGRNGTGIHIRTASGGNPASSAFYRHWPFRCCSAPNHSPAVVYLSSNRF